MAFLPVPEQPRDIGECIYCGDQQGELQREHAIPYGINGPWTLLRASCSKCAEITHRFERDTLRGLWPHVRNVLAMQTRRPESRGKDLPLVLERNGGQEVHRVPPADFPLYLPTPIFPPPGVLLRDTPILGISSNVEFIHLSGPSFEEIGAQYKDVDFVGTRVIYSPSEFGRTLAKIAFCMAVHALGLAPFTSTPIRGVILGEDPCVGHWVGGWQGEPRNEPAGLHAMQILASGSDIHVVLRLFAQFGAPEYHIVLGAADPAFLMSDAWPWK